MLIDFQFTNFRSFKDTAEFSMEAGAHLRLFGKSNVRKVNQFRLLKSAVLFGGNAHGKTNLIRAFWVLYYIIMVPAASEEQHLLTDTFAHYQENTSFRIEFIKDSTRFLYELQYNAKEVVYEKLMADNEVVIKRNQQVFEILPDQINSLQKNIRKNQLGLFFAQSNNVEIVKKAFSWFANDLIFADLNILNPMNTGILESLKESDFKEKFLAFLRAADFNIVDVEIIESNVTGLNFNLKMDNHRIVESNLLPNEMKQYRLITTHKLENDESFKVELTDESSGTQAFISIAMYLLLNEQSNGKVLLIDEFNASFHLELAQALLDLFNNENQNNQFIMTSHELSLMDYNLRQDQIYFAEKDKYGASELFSLFEFDDPALKRSDFAYKKRYLNGRYGAKPVIATSVLKEILGETDAKD
jgi:AAA15 family ATPase/GTPase